MITRDHLSNLSQKIGCTKSSSKDVEHECIYIPAPTTPNFTLNLNMNSERSYVRIIHPSLVGNQSHCFGIITKNPDGTSEISRHFKTGSAQERDQWMQRLRIKWNPNYGKETRINHSLTLWIQEAKNIPVTQHRYYCDIIIDQTLYARTSIRKIEKIIMWMEEFNFDNLPHFTQLTINLFRLSKDDKFYNKSSSKKRCSDEINTDLSLSPTVQQIAALVLSNSELESFACDGGVERWYNMSAVSAASPTSVFAKTATCNTLAPALRLKIAYKVVEVLSIDCYQHLIELICTSYAEIVQAFEQILNTKSKTEFSKRLVNISTVEQNCINILTELVYQEVSQLNDDNLVFRSNTIASKTMEYFMRKVGDQYLNTMLKDLIFTIQNKSGNCEIDPTKLKYSSSILSTQLCSQDDQLRQNQKNLITFVEMTWERIVNSVSYFPTELRKLFCNIRARLSATKSSKFICRIFSSFLFLRLICPSIMSPHLFGLSSNVHYCSIDGAETLRTLTLVAKVIQSLANFSIIDSKEEYMMFVNLFVQREFDSLTSFMFNISSPRMTYSLGALASNSSRLVVSDNLAAIRDDLSSYNEVADVIDVAYESALLHLQLKKELDLLTDKQFCKYCNDNQSLSSHLIEVVKSISKMLSSFINVGNQTDCDNNCCISVAQQSNLHHSYTQEQRISDVPACSMIITASVPNNLNEISNLEYHQVAKENLQQHYSGNFSNTTDLHVKRFDAQTRFSKEGHTIFTRSNDNVLLHRSSSRENNNRDYPYNKLQPISASMVNITNVMMDNSFKWNTRGGSPCQLILPKKVSGLSNPVQNVAVDYGSVQRIQCRNLSVNQNKDFHSLRSANSVMLLRSQLAKLQEDLHATDILLDNCINEKNLLQKQYSVNSRQINRLVKQINDSECVLQDLQVKIQNAEKLLNHAQTKESDSEMKILVDDNKLNRAISVTYS